MIKEFNKKTKIKVEFNKNELNEIIIFENISDELDNLIHHKIVRLINNEFVDFKEDQDILKNILDDKKK